MLEQAMTDARTRIGGIASRTMPGGWEEAQTNYRILRGQFLSVLLDLAERRGGPDLPIIPFRFFGQNAYLATHPRHIGPLLHDTESFRRNELFLRPMREALGFNAVTASDAEWPAVRKRTVQLLTGEYLRRYSNIMVRILDEDLVPVWHEQARRGEGIDVFQSMLDYSSKVVFMAFLGMTKERVPADVHGTLNTLFDYTRKRVFRVVPVPRWIPSPENLGYERLMRKISPVIEAEVARAGQGNDMVDVLKRAHGDDKQRMFEELLGNLIGGSETTIIFMTWLLHFLAHDLELQERLRKEVMGFDPTRDKVGDLHLLNDCIIECLRLRSPAFMTSRTAARDTRLGDIAIPAGTHVFGSQYITQIHPAVWKDPERFDPDRLRTRRPSNNKEQSDWFPFGGGKNVCAGQKYVFAEAGLGVARLLQHFRITPVSPLDVGMDPQLTMRPGIPVVVRATAIPSS